LSILEIKTARAFKPLLEPARYKGAHGGRGSGKSHFFGEMLIEDSLLEKGLLSVCIREVQKSLKDSAYRLLCNKLSDFGLGEKDGFKIYQDRIQTPGDGVIIFQGMQDHTAESIKSLEGFKRAWVEEAQTLSKTSLKLLRPTIRAPESELWFSWNPRFNTDPVDAMFREGQPPTNSVCIQANYSENPWFPKELEQERLDCLRDDPDQYGHIWEGDYVTVAEGAYFATHIADLKKRGGITPIQPDPLLPIKIFVDIGGTGRQSDAFSMWACQFVGHEMKWLNYYEAQGQELANHLDWLREWGYTPARAHIYLPHDGKTHDKVYSVSYESAFKSAGYTATVIPNQGKGASKQRIEAARRLFPTMWFDPKCEEAGLKALGWYHEKRCDIRGIGLGAEHDWSSHAADSFGLGCVVYKTPVTKKAKNKKPRINIA